MQHYMPSLGTGLIPFLMGTCHGYIQCMPSLGAGLIPFLMGTCHGYIQCMPSLGAGLIPFLMGTCHGYLQCMHSEPLVSFPNHFWERGCISEPPYVVLYDICTYYDCFFFS